MEKSEAYKIIKFLSEGIDPLTGEQLPHEHLVNQGDCVRALVTAVSALEYKRGIDKPKNQGKAWTKEADIEIREMFEKGMPVGKLAAHFSRSRSGIKARLVLLGLIERQSRLDG
jgi:hypothetical protein